MLCQKARKCSQKEEGTLKRYRNMLLVFSLAKSAIREHKKIMIVLDYNPWKKKKFMSPY